ncbi:MFS transporter [Nonomuraea sp. NPDC050790]|uniref:MFS transporter n=1 Tax=Nonomuraea sp. NPDC050790 TaxID=3364371 RepID=UPI00379EF477
MNTTSTAGKRDWIALGVLSSIALLLSVDVSVLYLALPHLSSELGASAPQQLWIMDIYSFMLAGFLVTMGTLGDRIGRRRLLLAGSAAFGLVSVAAAFSSSAEMLVVTRALLGIAGATLMPSSMALIRNIFRDPKQMGAAIGIWFSCFMVGMAAGPLVGGLLLQHFWWGSAFLLGVPFMVVVLVAGPLVLPEYRDGTAGRLDLASVALSLGAILPAIYGLKEITRSGWQPAAVLAVAAGAAMGVLFVRRQRRLADPLLDLRLFGDRAFAASLTILMLGGVVMAGITLTVTTFLQSVAGLSPLAAGLWMIPPSLVMIVALSAGPMLARRVQPAYVMAGGLALGAAGMALMTFADASGGVAVLVVGLVLAQAGIALPMGLGNGIMMAAAPPEKAGSAASISETSGEFGVAVGVAALGSLAAAVFRAGLPAGVDADTLAGAVAETLGDPALLAGARAAYTSGLHAVAGVGAAVFLGLAVLTVAVLRARPDRQERQATPEPALTWS